MCCHLPINSLQRISSIKSVSLISRLDVVPLLRANRISLKLISLLGKSIRIDSIDFSFVLICAKCETPSEVMISTKTDDAWFCLYQINVDFRTSTNFFCHTQIDFRYYVRTRTHIHAWWYNWQKSSMLARKNQSQRKRLKNIWNMTWLMLCKRAMSLVYRSFPFSRF